ncbi:MAG: shikimate kinase [Planctomycetes bacterium]|nr:shikimate kinase [Planctomycetota bacterium]
MTLVGMRASGKSTVGRATAILLGCPCIDADAALEERLGCSIAAWFARAGEASFREREAACLVELLAGVQPFVLATGGGAVVRRENRTLLAHSGGIVVYLHAEAAHLQERLRADAGNRPSLTGAAVADEVSALLAVRDPWYREIATHVLPAVESVDALAARIAALARA